MCWERTGHAHKTGSWNFLGVLAPRPIHTGVPPGSEFWCLFLIVTDWVMWNTTSNIAVLEFSGADDLALVFPSDTFAGEIQPTQRICWASRPGVLTIYKNHPVGNLRHKH